MYVHCTRIIWQFVNAYIMDYVLSFLFLHVKIKKVKKTQTRYTFVARYTVRKEMKCSGASEILHGLVHDTTRISSFFSDFRVVSWTNSCRISESPLHLISFLTVYSFVAHVLQQYIVTKINCLHFFYIFFHCSDVVVVMYCSECTVDIMQRIFYNSHYNNHAYLRGVWTAISF